MKILRLLCPEQGGPCRPKEVRVGTERLLRYVCSGTASKSHEVGFGNATTVGEHTRPAHGSLRLRDAQMPDFFLVCVSCAFCVFCVVWGFCWFCVLCCFCSHLGSHVLVLGSAIDWRTWEIGLLWGSRAESLDPKPTPPSRGPTVTIDCRTECQHV